MIDEARADAADLGTFWSEDGVSKKVGNFSPGGATGSRFFAERMGIFLSEGGDFPEDVDTLLPSACMATGSKSFAVKMPLSRHF